MYAAISSEELNDALIGDSGKYVSEKARAIDEHIFFFVPAALIHNGSEDEIEDFIKHHSGLWQAGDHYFLRYSGKIGKGKI